MFAYVTIYPISVCLFLISSGPKGLRNKNIKNHFGNLYNGLNIKSLINSQATTVFLLRRLIIGVSIAFFRRYYFLQLEILLVTCLFCMSYTILTFPYKTKLYNILEILNESMVLSTVYIMHGFSYFIPSSKERFKIGWFYIIIVILVFMLNLAVILYQIFLAVVKAMKKLKAKKNKAICNSVFKLF